MSSQALPASIAVPPCALVEAMMLLDEAARLRAGGWYSAHAVERRARALLAQMLEDAVPAE